MRLELAIATRMALKEEKKLSVHDSFSRYKPPRDGEAYTGC